MRHTIILLSCLVVLAVLIPNSISAQSDEILEFHGKGVIVGEHFKDGRIWISISGDSATSIFQWDLGRSKMISDVTVFSDCESNYSICLDATITNAHNSAGVEQGDQFTVKIDQDGKKILISGKSGFFENTDIVTDITKIY